MPTPVPVRLPESAARTNHVCWVYRDPGAFRTGAMRFLEEGLEAGQRLEYIGSGSEDGLRRDLETFPALRDLLGGDRLVVRSLDERYGVNDTVDPRGQVAAYAEATRSALADGYTGLRVAADATALVRTPEQREAFARYEHLVDRFMVDAPFVAICAYDAWELGAEAVAEIACLHPAATDGASAFHWWAEGTDDIGLAGEVDLVSREGFEAALARTLPLTPGPRVVVDARGVDFIDHQGLIALDRQARAADRILLLRTESSVIRRVVRLLDLRAVRVA